MQLYRYDPIFEWSVYQPDLRCFVPPVKQVGEYCIKKALASISEEDYEKTLAKLAAVKWEALRGEENVFIKKRKVQDHLLQKGYEMDRIGEALREIQENT